MPILNRKRAGKKNLLDDSRYLEFCARYQDNLVGYIVDHSRRKLTWQQLDVATAIEKRGSRVAVASGHGTGKSWILSWLIDWHLRVYIASNALLTATNIEQARSGIWKYLDEVTDDMDAAYPWMCGWFIKETKRYYMRIKKDSWYVLPKTASKGSPENVAGQHNENYIVIVDEASGVPDAVLGVLRGALTQGGGNRFVMVSQPTRPTGHFADAFGRLRDIYTTFNLNAELSPIVTKDFIREKMIEYGGHHSPEYQIKVLGCLPDNLSGYLIPRRWLEICQRVIITHDEPWGWVMTVDVAEGMFRDSSVFTLGRVSGHGDTRKVEVVECDETLDLNEKQFARKIYQRIQDMPSSITIAIDADGAGRTVILELEELGVNVEHIHWGLPCHMKSDQKRYKNQRAFAQVKLREAVFDERIRIAPGAKVLDQGAKLPFDMDDRGRYAMWPKDKMRGDGIKSPDLIDTHAFFYLVDYIPVEDSVDSKQDEMLSWAKKILEGDSEE